MLKDLLNFQARSSGAWHANRHFSHYALMSSAQFPRNAVSQPGNIPGQRFQLIIPKIEESYWNDEPTRNT
jgi:hypothetical protein